MIRAAPGALKAGCNDKNQSEARSEPLRSSWPVPDIRVRFCTAMAGNQRSDCCMRSVEDGPSRSVFAIELSYRAREVQRQAYVAVRDPITV